MKLLSAIPLDTATLPRVIKLFSPIPLEDSNLAFGYQAGSALNSGSNNVFIGSNACGSITAANNFFCFGNSAGTPLAFNSNSGNVILGKENGNSQVTIHGDLYVTGNIINANAGINTGTQNSDIDQISEITLGY